MRDDFGPESDLNILLTFAPGAEWGLLDHVMMEQELASLLGCKVDLLTKRAVERSPNWILRREILSTAKVI
ncbi:nucleotidyltransferase [bacterium]|nr:nucleotidyltransferase [bacterium]